MKKLLIIILCMPIIGLGQDNKLEKTKPKKISFDGMAGIGMGFVQDKNSPITFAKVGIVNDNFKLHFVGSSNYFFSTEIDGSRKVLADQHLGIEWLMPSSFWYKDRDDDKWGGLGFSYCFNNKSELQEKKPIKAYIIYYFGIISVTTEYVWSDFHYPALSVRFEY